MTTSATTAGNGLHQNHASFLERFNARQAQNRAAKQKPTLSVEEHAAHRAQLGKVRFIKPRYSEQTEINVSGIFNKWRRYVAKPPSLLCNLFRVLTSSPTATALT